MAALKTMESPEILKKAHDEWLAETNGIYECPIPKEIGPEAGGLRELRAQSKIEEQYNETGNHRQDPKIHR